MTTKSIVLRRGIAFAIIECETTVHTIRAASYECAQAKGELKISFELCPAGTSARLEASEVFDAPIRKISLPDLLVQKRLLGFLKEINSTGQFWWVVIRLDDRTIEYRVALALSLGHGIELQVVHGEELSEHR
jgi:hypothetical protein